MHRFALSLAAASLLATPAAAAVQVTASGPIVELTINESVEAEPDIATVGAGVTTQARTAVEAMRLNAQQMSAVVDRIKQLGVAERDIQTTGINLGAQYDYDQASRRQVFRGYQASNRVSVKLRQVERTGEVLDALVAAGATDLSGPDWSIDDDTAARAQARRQAMETARTQALEYARADRRDIGLGLDALVDGQLDDGAARGDLDFGGGGGRQQGCCGEWQGETVHQIFLPIDQAMAGVEGITHR